MILSLLVACSNDPVSFRDDTDLVIDLGLTPADRLNSPYVRGASFRVDASHRWVKDHEGWSIEVSDPEVLSVEAQRPELDDKGRAYEIEADLVAVGEGEVELFLVDDKGERRGSAVAEVRFPERVELSPHGPLMVDREDLFEERHLLIGGETTTLLARYFHGELELAGTGVLDFESTSGLSLETDLSLLGEDRDWLLVTPDASLSEARVPLLVDGEEVQAFEFDVVAPEELTELRLLGLEEEDEAEQGHHIEVLAQPFAEERPAYGGEARWMLDGADDEELGDVLVYDFDEDRPRQVVANIAGISREATVHGVDLGIRSSDQVGCSSLGLGASIWALLGLPLLWFRRRR